MYGVWVTYLRLGQLIFEVLHLHLELLHSGGMAARIAGSDEK